MAFFKLFRIDYENNPVLIENTDGVWKGVILEFKKVIDDLNSTLKQAIKYLSRLRIHGESVPANILLVSLNKARAYLYRSQDYFDEIHKVYFGPASKDNVGFIADKYKKEYDLGKDSDVIEIQHLLRKEEYMPIRIDEDSVVGWGRRYYRENPTARKGDFIGDSEGQVKTVGEIRDPRYFKGLILPFTGATNERFKYLLDELNDKLTQQELGAFFTPTEYCEKACELVRKAIERVPDGNDYIILDRCAGTGNLESVLPPDIQRHCILSTYEYYEYKVLFERLCDNVKAIIPPNESLVEYSRGFVENANALGKEYIGNEYIAGFINNPKYTVILFENPPYQDSSSLKFVDEDGNRATVSRNDSMVKTEFTKKALSRLNEQRGAAREISNLFIWSGFEYYLRQPTDSFIIFSPVKYFKSIGLVRKDFLGGFLFNRKHFHASPSAISCILWSNSENDPDREEFPLDAYDIANGGVEFVEKVTIKKVHSRIAELNDNRVFESDANSRVVCASNGREKVGWFNESRAAKGNDNIIAYMAVNGFTTDGKHRYLLRLPYNVGIEQSFGFYVRNDNFLEKLPLFCAKAYPQKEWWHREVYFTSCDGGREYVKDRDFLRTCLLYTCLCFENKCMTISASDGRTYYNELCLDGDTLAARTLKDMALSDSDKDLISSWETLLESAKSNKNHNPDCRYGSYQINSDLNTFTRDEYGDSHPDDPKLNGDIRSLKSKLQDYYNTQILPKLFEYELLK